MTLFFDLWVFQNSCNYFFGFYYVCNKYIGNWVFVWVVVFGCCDFFMWFLVKVIIVDTASLSLICFNGYFGTIFLE